MVKFSVIVPMYNVEKYIGECIESVLSQSLSDYELILIDDDSEDKTLEIARTYERDQRVKIITQTKRSGVSETRNIGLKYVSGEYVVFLDGDDYLDCHHLENINEAVNLYKSDICIANAVIFARELSCDRFEFFPYGDRINYGSREDVLRLFFNRKFTIPGSVCLSTYNIEFLRKNNIYFNKFICAEDFDFLMSAVVECNSIKIVNGGTYYYRQNNPNACTALYDKEKVLSCLYVYQKWFDYFSVKGTDSYIKDELGRQFAENFCRVQNLPESDKLEVIEYIKRCEYIYKKVFFSTYSYYVFFKFPFRHALYSVRRTMTILVKAVIGDKNYSKIKMWIKG